MKFIPFATSSKIVTSRSEPVTLVLSPTEACALECVLGYESISPAFRKELQRVLAELQPQQ
jgi:hypothetical protein